MEMSHLPRFVEIWDSSSMEDEVLLFFKKTPVRVNPIITMVAIKMR